MVSLSNYSMKAVVVVVQMSLLLLCVIGCEPTDAELARKTDSVSNPPSEYGPAKVYITPLTEFTATGDDEKPSNIKVHVSLLDEFDCQIKAPVVFRFELYDKVPLSAVPKGERIFIWPDIDLNNAAKNNDHWKDFLRTYEFNLPFEPKKGNTYILQVTALRPNGKRLSAEFTLKYTN